MPTLSELSAGEIVSAGKFMSYLKSALPASQHNVILFLQDEVSDDHEADFLIYKLIVVSCGSETWFHFLFLGHTRIGTQIILENQIIKCKMLMNHLKSIRK